MPLLGGNKDENTRPLARPLAYLLASLTQLLAPHCLLCLCAPLRSFLARSLTLARENVCRAAGSILFVRQILSSLDNDVISKALATSVLLVEQWFFECKENPAEI